MTPVDYNFAIVDENIGALSDDFQRITEVNRQSLHHKMYRIIFHNVIQHG